MKRLTLIVFLLCSLICAPIFFSACGSPAAPPAPPVEVPSPVVLKFVEPTDLQIDLSTIAMATTPSISKAVDPGGEFSNEIAAGYELQQYLFGSYFNPILNGIGKLEIPVSETTTTYHEVIDFGPPPEEGGEVMMLLTGTRDVKISFEDFDFDNDGNLEGCSGHTAALPICVRMWLDDFHYLAWIFQTYPYFDDPTTTEVENSPGLGEVKLYAYFVTDYALDNWLMRFDYDFATVEHNDVLWALRLFGDDGSGMGFHSHLMQDGPVETAVKQIAYQMLIGDENMDDLWDDRSDYLAQYRDGYDFWSGSILSSTGGRIDFNQLQDITNQCAVIKTGNRTDNENCADVGGIDIRVGGIPFLEPFDAAYIALPNNFPAAPPAGMFP